jgi:hypothetical protein
MGSPVSLLRVERSGLATTATAIIAGWPILRHDPNVADVLNAKMGPRLPCRFLHFFYKCSALRLTRFRNEDQHGLVGPTLSAIDPQH